jgi:acyl carrier protein phosphodiesterase
MNYLAHAYLSFNQPEILAGNMISDYVKGKQKFTYPAGIQKGMALHRAIDQFTDAHEIVKEAKAFFRPQYRLYAGAFTDVVFDHYLARLLAQTGDLKQFTTGVYAQLAQQHPHFPPPFAHMFPHMCEHDWLFNYQFNWGVERSFGGLQRRAQYITETAVAFQVFQQEYSSLEKHFHDFWPLLHQFAKTEFDHL